MQQPRLTSYPIDPSFSGRSGPSQAVRVEALGRVAMFRGLSKRNLVRIDQISRAKTAREGDVLMTQGQPGDEMMVVMDGRAKVRRGRRKIGEITAGQCFGEMALLENEPRSATITAIEPMRLVVIPGAGFRKLLMKVPALALAMLTTMSTRLREADATADY